MTVNVAVQHLSGAGSGAGSRLGSCSPHALLREYRCAVARESLVEYCRMLWPDEEPALHHRVILEALQDVADGKCKRLLITAPPGSAKTAYVGVRFASWFRGLMPGVDMIAASHTQELADKSARRVRNVCLGDEWREVWAGAEVSGDSSAVNRWTMAGGGDYFACGVGGTVVGRRGSGVLLDDLSGGVSDAMGSRVTRESVWDWYTGDLLPRLKPGAWVVAVGTCFHSEDFIGRVRQMAASGVEEWRMINLPMLAEDVDVLGRKPGDRLWPEYFTSGMVEVARRNPDTWMALYQQRPIVESGQYFKREWMMGYGPAERPENLRVYGSSDYAVTHGGGDFTVHVVVGVAEDGRIYVLDMWRGQATTEVWVRELVRLIRQWKPLEWFEEKGQIAKGVGPFIDRVLMDEKAHVYRSQYAMPRGADGFNSKQVGAQSIRGRMGQGMVLWPHHAPWYATVLEELMAFPTEKAGVHDDCVDAISLVGRALDMMRAASKPLKVDKPRFRVDLTMEELLKHSKARRLAGIENALRPIDP